MLNDDCCMTAPKLGNVFIVDSNKEEIKLTKPTKEEYEKAKAEREYFGKCLHLSRKRKDELIDELCKEREAEKHYKDMYEQYRDTVRRYEIYEEIQNE